MLAFMAHHCGKLDKLAHMAERSRQYYNLFQIKQGIKQYAKNSIKLNSVAFNAKMII